MFIDSRGKGGFMSILDSLNTVGNLGSLFDLLASTSSSSKSTPIGGQSFSNELKTRLAELQSGAFQTLLSNTGTSSSTSGHSIIDFLAGTSAGSSLPGLGGVSGLTAGLTGNGFNLSLSDPASAFAMMTKINSLDATYKAQFAELSEMGGAVGLSIASESALVAGLVMGIMIIPFVSSLSDDIITAVPNSLREGSYGLGATKSETVKQVILPAALPGIVGGVLLAVSRAIGETMIVVMAAGLSANLTANPFEAVTTVTVQIVTLLVGDQEFDSPKTLAAFALGLVLFFVTLALNIVALHVVRKYREQYD